MRYLGLDVGDRRIGVAFGETEVRMATPVQVIVRASPEQDARAIAKLVGEYAAEQIVVGLPQNMDGTQGAQAELVRVFAEQVAPIVKLPVWFWDERLTTVEATRRIHETGARGKKSRRALDAIAAAVILQDFLDHKGTTIP
jgi:putative holliday junction resolvase